MHNYGWWKSNSSFLSSYSSVRLITSSQLNTTVDISSDEKELDHRLHFQVATEHFTHNNEQVKFHFKVNSSLFQIFSFMPSFQCFVVRSTTNKHFIAQTILTDYGIYIFQYESYVKLNQIYFIDFCLDRIMMMKRNIFLLEKIY
jgi:hypothetical protein